jgi:pimeloyl-ACP methyl ester carboxylesterase
MRRSSAAVVLFLTAATPLSAGERRYDVGGFRLNLKCEGNGSPVVVFDAGAGDTLQTWDWVVPDLKKLTRVCAYDRAGLGKSDPGPRPRPASGSQGAWRALKRAHLPPPYRWSATRSAD